MKQFTLLTIACGMALFCAPTAHAASHNPHFAQLNLFSAEAPVPLKFGAECDSNYSGACVPIASDVDCASGGGNGPEYVGGPVIVEGTDIYELDRDGNGTGCES